MNGPLVSVIMPAFNVERYIAESIQSVIAQTYRVWELIIIDDGSTDATADVVQGFASSDSRIRLVSQQNQKLARARNAGMRQSEGELIAFLDSDDLWIKEKLELQVKALRENAADLVFSDGFIFHDNNVFDESLTFATLVGGFDGAEMFTDLMLRNRIPVLSVLTRRKVLDEVGGFDETRDCGAEDYDLWLRIARCGYRFYGMRERLVRYRVRIDSMSRRTVDMLKSEVAVIEKHLAHSNMDGEFKRRRRRHLYRSLAAALTEADRPGEAGKYLAQLLFREKGGLTTILQILALGVWPKKFNDVSAQLYRIEASFSYRIERPITRAWERSRQLLTKRRAD
jgi:teichuronic acid biosynthesis glycosyltransferase TuaG